MFQYLFILDESNKIYINNLEVYNITITMQLKSYDCEQQKPINQTIFFQCIQNDDNKKAPFNLQFSYGDCFLSQIEQQYAQKENLLIDNKNSGLFLFLDLTQLTQIKLNNLIFQQINCRICLNGLIFYSFKKVDDLLLKQYVSNLKIFNSTCGDYGCFQLIKENAVQQRILMKSEINIQKMNLEIIIDKYICLYNNAKNDTCLYLDNLKLYYKILFFNIIMQPYQAEQYLLK
ncbi:unnamed protein product [Paramecium sonneborni]|uniref:Uncharacterized protein n=1 Tax=Paramecium sonneborni TaxID=65129 RepID=A0A8S1QJ09_9CILI|nr:unnamed protein product [Paramecium sonneborni]